MGRFSFINELLKPWSIRILIFIFAAVELYDAASNQFGWPKIPTLWGMTPNLQPWWAWLLAIIVYALFEYVRVQSMTTNYASVDSKLVSQNDQEIVPDVTLSDLGLRVLGIISNDKEWDSRAELERAANLQIADKIKQSHGHVWARYADFPIQALDQDDFSTMIFDIRKGTVAVPNEWHTNVYTDVQFSSVEVDKIWPVA